GGDREFPTLPSWITTIVHSTQIEKPRGSAKIEKARFLRAIRLPVVSQNCSFSGSQSSIQRPLTGPEVAVAAALAASIVVMWGEARTGFRTPVCAAGRGIAPVFRPSVDG